MPSILRRLLTGTRQAFRESFPSHPLMAIKTWVRMLTPLLYPDHCPFCDCLLPYGRQICRSCYEQLPYTGRRVCYCCGKPVSSLEQELCYDCRIFPKSFQGGCSLYLYNKITQPAILRLKYHNHRTIAAFFAADFYRYQREQLLRWHIKAIIPVPVHKNKRKKRGYNQAELIGKVLAAQLGVPCLTDLLIRHLDTPPQKELSAQARLTNLQKAFSFNFHSRNAPLLGDHSSILIIDDIYTTGATMETCARILLANGAGAVYAASICIGFSRD